MAIFNNTAKQLQPIVCLYCTEKDKNPAYVNALCKDLPWQDLATCKL